MAIQSLSYLNIPEARRREMGSKALQRVYEALHDPMLSEEQRGRMQERIERLNQWVAGTLPVTEPPPPLEEGS